MSITGDGEDNLCGCMTSQEILFDMENVSKEFIFITKEGYKFQSNSESETPDIENMQVIGFESGVNIFDAFENLKANSPYLENTTFNEILGFELCNIKPNYFTLKN